MMILFFFFIIWFDTGINAVLHVRRKGQFFAYWLSNILCRWESEPFLGYPNTYLCKIIKNVYLHICNRKRCIPAFCKFNYKVRELCAVICFLSIVIFGFLVVSLFCHG